MEALAVLLTLEGTGTPVRAVLGVGLQEERREPCQARLAPVLHILGRMGESLDEEISRNCREGGLFSAYVFAKSQRQAHALLNFKPDFCKNKANKQNHNVLVHQKKVSAPLAINVFFAFPEQTGVCPEAALRSPPTPLPGHRVFFCLLCAGQAEGPL